MYCYKDLIPKLIGMTEEKRQECYKRLKLFETESVVEYLESKIKTLEDNNSNQEESINSLVVDLERKKNVHFGALGATTCCATTQ